MHRRTTDTSDQCTTTKGSIPIDLGVVIHYILHNILRKKPYVILVVEICG